MDGKSPPSVWDSCCSSPYHICRPPGDWSCCHPTQPQALVVRRDLCPPQSFEPRTEFLPVLLVCLQMDHRSGAALTLQILQVLVAFLLFHRESSHSLPMQSQMHQIQMHHQMGHRFYQHRLLSCRHLHQVLHPSLGGKISPSALRSEDGRQLHSGKAVSSWSLALDASPASAEHLPRCYQLCLREFRGRSAQHASHRSDYCRYCPPGTLAWDPRPSGLSRRQSQSRPGDQ
mmetsp:Transcript_73795/g.117432  ORF Transcript_73795/g.117432 Transcript_73795/m.117432 type:complete len:230 (+) Transcript_73795:648-1337(+)